MADGVDEQIVTVRKYAVGLEPDQKPMLSREAYDRAKVILNVLPAGFYAKCWKCSGWFRGGTFRQDPEGPVCEGCRI